MMNQIMKCVLLFPEGKDAILDFVDIFRWKSPTPVTPDLLCDIFRDCKSIDHLTRELPHWGDKMEVSLEISDHNAERSTGYVLTN